jgi:hypothetical protein
MANENFHCKNADSSQKIREKLVVLILYRAVTPMQDIN